MKKNTKAVIENFEAMMEMYPGMIRETETRYTIGRNWVYKTHLQHHLGGNPMTIAKEMEQMMVEAITTTEEMPMVSSKSYSVMEFKATGTCYSSDCKESEKGQLLGEFFGALEAGFDKVNETDVARHSLNFKAGKVESMIKANFKGLDYIRVKKDNDYDGDTSFSDTFGNVFVDIKSIKTSYVNQEGEKVSYSFPDFMNEVEKMFGNKAMKVYHKYATAHSTIKTKFWNAHRANKSAWNDIINPIVEEYADRYNCDATIREVVNAIKEPYTKENGKYMGHSVDIDFTVDNEAVCACCGESKYISIDGTKSHLEHLGIKSWDVNREMKEWTEAGKNGIKYIFDGSTEVVDGVTMAKIVGEFMDMGAADLDLDIDVEMDEELDLDFDMDDLGTSDLELDLDIVVGTDFDMVGDNDDEVVSDADADDTAGHMMNSIVTGAAADYEINDWDTDYAWYTDMIDEQDNEYKDARYTDGNTKGGYDWIIDMDPEQAADKIRFINGFNAIFGTKDMKKEYREIEATHTASVVRDFEKLLGDWSDLGRN